MFIPKGLWKDLSPQYTFAHRDDMFTKKDRVLDSTSDSEQSHSSLSWRTSELKTKQCHGFVFLSTIQHNKYSDWEPAIYFAHRDDMFTEKDRVLDSTSSSEFEFVNKALRIFDITIGFPRAPLSRHGHSNPTTKWFLNSKATIRICDILSHIATIYVPRGEWGLTSTSDSNCQLTIWKP